LGEKKTAYRLLIGKPEGRRPLGRPRRGWVDNVKMNLGEIGSGGMDWNGLGLDRDKRRAVVNAVTDFPVPQSAGKISRVVLNSMWLVSLCTRMTLLREKSFLYTSH
jgi:hypothetical protein